MILSYKYDFDINLRQWSINTTIKHQGYIRVRGEAVTSLPVLASLLACLFA